MLEISGLYIGPDFIYTKRLKGGTRTLEQRPVLVASPERMEAVRKMVFRVRKELMGLIIDLRDYPAYKDEQSDLSRSLHKMQDDLTALLERPDGAICWTCFGEIPIEELEFYPLLHKCKSCHIRARLERKSQQQIPKPPRHWREPSRRRRLPFPING